MSILRKHLVFATAFLVAAGTAAQGLRLGGPALPAAPSTEARAADFIVAVVNSEPITQHQVRFEAARILAELPQGMPRPADQREALNLVLDRLIDERIQIQWARALGIKIEDSAVDEAEASVARQNQISLEQLQQRLAADGMDRAVFRNQLRDQILLFRVREREVAQRVRVSEREIDQHLQERRDGARVELLEIDLAHMLVALPEDASAAQVERARARAEELLAMARKEPDFARLAREHSNAPDAASGGQFGMRPLDRYPTLFAESAKGMAVGDLVVVRSGAGFHVLKLLDRREAGMPASQRRETRASHILLRHAAQQGEQAAIARLEAARQRVGAGEITFEALAREISQDGSAAQGGDLGWAGPGMFVPEFEAVMNQLPIGQLSEPFVTRFGVHLLLVKERRIVPLSARQIRDAVRALLRVRKLEEALTAWAQELRARAYVEMRQPPGG